jgi:hypothetical protein
MKWETVKKKWTSFSEFQNFRFSVLQSPHVLDIGNTEKLQAENTHGIGLVHLM